MNETFTVAEEVLSLIGDDDDEDVSIFFSKKTKMDHLKFKIQIKEFTIFVYVFCF